MVRDMNKELKASIAGVQSEMQASIARVQSEMRTSIVGEDRSAETELSVLEDANFTISKPFIK